MVRQTLVGSDYGMLDRKTLEPNPDYYNSLLWKRLMGRRVLDLKVRGNNPYLRAYAHCRRDVADGAVLLLINTHETSPASVRLPDGTSTITRYDLSASSLDSRSLELNGKTLSLESGKLPELEGRERVPSSSRIEIPPLQYSFIELPGLSVAACSNGA
jgi:heparanase 1